VPQTLLAVQTLDESSCVNGVTVGGNTTTSVGLQTCPQLSRHDFEVLFNASVAQYVSTYPNIYALELNSTVYIEAPANYIQVQQRFLSWILLRLSVTIITIARQDNMLRATEVTHLELEPADVYYDVLATTFSADFNDFNKIHSENRLALLLTTFSILLLFVAMAVFVVDANKLSKQINVPLDELNIQVSLIHIDCRLFLDSENQGFCGRCEASLKCSLTKKNSLRPMCKFERSTNARPLFN